MTNSGSKSAGSTSFRDLSCLPLESSLETRLLGEIARELVLRVPDAALDGESFANLDFACSSAIFESILALIRCLEY